MKRTLIKLLAETWPTFRIPAALSPRFARELRQEREIHSRSMNQLAIFPELSAVFTDELLGAIRRADANFIRYHGKVLILCPLRDNICAYSKIRKSVAIHDQHNLEIIDIPDAGHNLLIDPETRNSAIEKIIPWLRQLERHLAFTGEDNILRIVGASKSENKSGQKTIVQVDKPGASKL